MNKWMIVGGLILVLAIGGLALLLGLPLLSTTPAAAQAPESEIGGTPERVMILAVEEVVNGERHAGEVQVTFEDPPELPAGPEDVGGLFLDRDGNTLTLGTGAIEVDVGVTVVNDEDPTTVVNASHDGDEVMVVVSDDTVIFKDTTSRPRITPADLEAGELKLARSVAPGNLDEIGANMLIRAWGTMLDGKLVADLIVYESIR